MFFSSQGFSFKHVFWQWIVRRSPKANKVVLQHKSIYVLPTKHGLVFLVVILLLWLLGTNYQNNLILATAFLLVGLVLVSILHAFKNLAGLTFEALSSAPVFVDKYAEFAVLVTTKTQTKYENVQVILDPSFPVTVDMITEREQRINVAALAKARGWCIPERILIKTYFPLGLVRAWSWIHLDMKALVYPNPVVGLNLPLAQLNESDGDVISRENPEDFYGLSHYQPGMPIARIAWKPYARGAGLHLKDYVGYQSQDIWLDWHALSGLDTELRLSQLCYWVLELSKMSNQYGLRLPHKTFAQGTGEAHKHMLLRALALYPDDDQ